MAEAIKEKVLQTLQDGGVIKDTEELAKANGWDHDKVVGVVKSLEAESMVTNTPMKRDGWKLTGEGEKYSKDGMPEVHVFNKVLAAKGSATQASLDGELGDVAKIGVGTAMKNKWISMDKATKSFTASLDKVADETQKDLLNLSNLGKDKLDVLKKRKLVAPTSITSLKVEKTDKFSMDAKKAVGAITKEMLDKGTWNDTSFKAVNLSNVKGADPCGGHLHPLSKVKTEIRTALTLMGFAEMKTNQWVESSFWNFDSLFQPQQHPARDAHDTFFIDSPHRAQDLPMDYLNAVKDMHENGGGGSIGWRYDWSEDEARKNILRTHTTSVSARTLHALGQEYQKTGTFTPKKCFSIDRVFRNETLDATHLAEFHQVEGFVADRNLGLGHLIGVLKEFFARVGISRLRFKPAYNPYTEPSMEIFGYHPILKKWIEVGNSGVFRPEMLLPMGLPEDVTVVAWGIGLERWAALLYNVRSIKELFSFQQDIAGSKKNPVCWLKRAEDEPEEKKN
jgi:phenylalanyl-tRNA synthetase alpha chain